MTDPKTPPGNARVIAIRGAREHNLKNIDVAIPRDRLVVFTGLSGSGKSSLAFDTIYAEGQRRYVESLSAYARQFLEMMQKPDVDQIDGLSPAISIEQKTTSKNPRSTVGTVTEIYDYMRLLWARVGIPYSPATGLPIESQTVSQMVDRVLELPDGTRIYVLAPLVRGRKGEYRKELADLLKKGYQRVKIDGAFHEIQDVKSLDKKFTHDIDVVVDRLVVRGDIATRLADGLAVIELADSKATGAAANRGRNANAERLIFSEKFACPVSGFTIPEIEPRLFSFNNPFGACPECGGLGLEQHIDAELVIPDKNASLRKGAIAPWAKSSSPYYLQTLTALAKHYRFSLDTKWKDLPKKTQNAILYGSGDNEIKFVYDDGLRGYTTKKPFEGVVTNLERRFHETESEWAREDLAKYFTDVPCHACHGARLKPEALCVKIAGATIAEVADLSIRRAGEWVAALPARLNAKQNEIAGRILKEIRERLRFLVDVGLDYLTLSRASGTLSGGESQRIRLASQIGSGLTGVLYVLDEPSIGLHQRDNARLLETLKRLRDLGNTVIVVEHDEDAIRTA
ncbi:MAG: excinuclease ABC subunit UvrA, partial [Pseudolabrys sp.]